MLYCSITYDNHMLSFFITETLKEALTSWVFKRNLLAPSSDSFWYNLNKTKKHRLFSTGVFCRPPVAHHGTGKSSAAICSLPQNPADLGSPTVLTVGESLKNRNLANLWICLCKFEMQSKNYRQSFILTSKMEIVTITLMVEVGSEEAQNSPGLRTPETERTWTRWGDMEQIKAAL